MSWCRLGLSSCLIQTHSFQNEGVEYSHKDISERALNLQLLAAKVMKSERGLARRSSIVGCARGMVFNMESLVSFYKMWYCVLFSFLWKRLAVIIRICLGPKIQLNLLVLHRWPNCCSQICLLWWRSLRSGSSGLWEPATGALAGIKGNRSVIQIKKGVFGAAPSGVMTGIIDSSSSLGWAGP